MILDKPEHTLQRGGLAGEKQFKIALSSKIYSMLSDKLYTDRIGSVVREICSNAWDGMKMKSIATGNPIEPFRVTLPTDLEPHFTVEDFGVGMPDEQAQELYSTLGLSTKENTNDQIGAFGLGSKSPFAVTDTFTVENTYEGVTYYYLCFKSEDGLPSILPTGKKVEDRPNGVKVIIPSSGYNYSSYRTALQRQLIAMEPKPIVTNGLDFEFVDPEILSENEFGYTLTNATAFGLKGRSIYAKMGMVFYPVDKDQINLDWQEKNSINALSVTSSLVLNLPIGAVEPVPSREGLTYDTRTIKNLRNQYYEYNKLFRKQLADSVSKMTDPLDAYNEIVKIRATTSVNLFHENIHINGWPINEGEQPHIFPTFVHEYLYTPLAKTDAQGNLLPDDEQDKPELKKVTESKFQYETFDTSDTRLNIKRGLTSLKGMKFSFLNSIINGNHKFLIWDEIDPKHRISRMKSILNGLSRHQRLFVVKQNPLYKGVQNDFSEFIKGLDMIRPGTSAKCVTYFSKVPKPEFERGARKAREEDAKFEGVVVIKPDGGTYEYDVKPSVLEELSEEDGFEGNACYIKLHRNDCVDYPRVKIERFKEFANQAKIYLFLIRATGMSKIKTLEEAGVVEFKDCINTLMDNYTPTDAFKKRESCVELYDDRQDWFGPFTALNMRTLINALSNKGQFVHPFFNIWTEVHDIKNSKIVMDRQTLVMIKLKDQGMFDMFNDKEWYESLAVDVTSSFVAAENSLKEKYPLLAHLFTSDNGYSYNSWLKDARYRYVVDCTLYQDMKNQEITVSPY